jgi:uncharacterized membrane protein YdfJ with MMPL/SSD domain
VLLSSPPPWPAWQSLHALTGPWNRFAPIGDWLRHALVTIAQRAGIPVVVVAAIALVLSLRIARRAVRIVVEIAVAAVILAVATQHGWVHW